MRFWDNIITIIFLAVLFLPPIIYYIYKFSQSGGRERRAVLIEKFAKRSGLTFKHYFSKFIKDFGGMNCFYDMLDPSFCNVIEKLDKENGDVYIGELQWDIAVERQQRHRRNRITLSDFMPSGGAENRYIRIKKETTLCVLYDDGFKLPNFDLVRETFKDKAVEVLRMNKTEDIDFDNDKEFSNAWWLSSNENMIVSELFTSTVRSSFMKYVDSGYHICGERNAIFIMTKNPLTPDKYAKVLSDIRFIARFLKTNKKFYTPYAERQLENN